MVEYYSVDLKCQNCKKLNWIKIPVGMTINEFGIDENKICRSCGCEVIKVKEAKEEKEEKPSKPIEVDEDNSNLS